MEREQDQDLDPFVRGLQRIIERDGWKMKPLSLAAGLGETAVRDLFRKDSSPKVSTARALAAAVGESIDGVIAFGEGLPIKPTSLGAPPPGEVLVNVWDIEVSAGNGRIAPEEERIAERLAFPADYLQRLTSTHPSRLQILSVKGRSMLTTLSEDDVVMIDQTKRHLGHDGIFVIRLDDAMHVKRISRSSRRGWVRIISDNVAEFPEFERPLEEIEVLGRVIWAGKRM